MLWFKRKGVIEPKMVRIRPGEFVMGAPDNELGTQNSERPQHKVRINYDFEVAKYPVTFQEWDAAAILGAFDHYGNGEHPRDRGWGRGTRPVIHVNYRQAWDYVEFLNSKTRGGYRLLSEAEWEYCCRAGTNTPYSFGKAITRRQANFKYWQTVPVNSFPANRFGLVGLHGNVWEWCADCWHSNYNGAPTNGNAWITECEGSPVRAVVRGGSFNIEPEYLRSASRQGVATIVDLVGVDIDDLGIIGFRLARTPPR